MKSWRLENGRRLAYRESGDGPPLVLVHGWGMSSAIFNGAVEGLRDRFRVLAPDLRGHGESDPSEGYRFGHLASDLRQWLTGLDLFGATLLGWSMGGQVLLTLYPMLRERIARLVLVSSTPAFAVSEDWSYGLPATRVRVMRRSVKRDIRRTLDDFFSLQFAGETLASDTLEELSVRYRREVPLPDPSAAEEGLEELAASDQRQHLSSIDCPVLVVHGEKDGIVPVEAGRYLHRELPRSELSILPGAGHAPFLSRPKETLELWRSFIP